MADAATISSPPKKKKLPFKRTVARRQPLEPSSNDAIQSKDKNEAGDGDGEEGLKMFRRTEEELPLLIEEQERLAKEKNEGKMNSAAGGRSTSPDSQDFKRRKMSEDMGVDNDGVVPGSAKRRDLKRCISPLSIHGSMGPKTVSPFIGDDEAIVDVKGKGKEILRPKDLRSGSISHHANTAPTVISIDDDTLSATQQVIGEPSGPTSRPSFLKEPSSPSSIETLSRTNSFAEVPPRRQAATAAADHEDDEVAFLSDAPNNSPDEPLDEFEIYVRRAREREEQAKKVVAAAAVTNAEKYRANAKDSSPAAAPGGPVIKIMVTSEIPGTKPLIFMRRYTHHLGAVRDGWVNHKENGSIIPDVIKSQIFLTWKGNRIYNATSCASLGVDLDEDGQLSGSRFADLEDGLHRGGLHLEAWSEDLYAEYQDHKERKRARFLQLGAEEAPAERNEGTKEKEEVLIKVTLKTRDYEPLKFKVYPHSTVKDMISTFRSQRQVPPGREISIHFDGDKLDENMVVKDTEIEDMDNLEVHIK